MTVVCGHTHMPFTRLAHRRQIINPGSVGMPYGREGAHWALLADGAVTMRRTGYDPQAACAAIGEQSSYPDVAEWADYFVHAKRQRRRRTRRFAPRDGPAPRSSRYARTADRPDRLGRPGRPGRARARPRRRGPGCGGTGRVRPAAARR